MNEWSAIWINNPDDDYNLVLEIYCDNEYVAIIKQSKRGKQGIALIWDSSPKWLTIPVDWLSRLLQGALEGIVNCTTINEEIHIGQWTADEPCDNNDIVRKIFCDGNEVAVIKHSKDGLILEWHSTPKGLVMPVGWLSELLLDVVGR